MTDQNPKKDAGKPRLGLVFDTLLMAAAEARLDGRDKYGATAWERVEDWRWQDAVLRHMFSHIRGEMFDSQSGLPHLSHVACNLMFLVENQRRGRKDVFDFLGPSTNKTQPVEVSVECPWCHTKEMYPVGIKSFCVGGCGTIIKG